MRSGRSLRMVLHREKRHPGPLQSFNSVVVEIPMRKFSARPRRFVIDRETMILRGDLDLPRLQIHHRMVGPMMTEIKLVSLAAKREA